MSGRERDRKVRGRNVVFVVWGEKAEGFNKDNEKLIRNIIKRIQRLALVKFTNRSFFHEFHCMSGFYIQKNFKSDQFKF
jgi:hypothetical protein